jgi:lipopolysaccharide transport system ATP-binding protein
MKARLTFAVAVSVEPDILIVDEALAAGDMLFITKCIQRIEDICASGATVLFVSHSLAMVERFCSRVLYMDHGAVVQEGNAHEVCKAYELACLTNDSEAMQLQIKSEPPKEIGTGQVRIKDFLILDETGKGCDVLRVGQRCRFEIELESHESFSNVLVSVQFIGEDARTIFSTSSSAFLNAESQEASIEIPLEKGRQCVRVHVPHFLAGAGRYFITVGVAPNLQKNSYTDFYDVRWKQWAVTVQREALTQNVALELPCTWETVLK